MKAVDLHEPQEPEENPGGLYVIALPGKLMSALAEVAQAQGVSTASLLTAAIDRLIQEHKHRGR